MISVLDAFHPAVRAWFAERFATPSPAQALGWPAIAGCDSPPGHDVLLCAPTGSGKTLAAFMWAIDRLFCDAERGELGDRVSVLYVSPLKALANDIRINLEDPLIGIRQTAHRLAAATGRGDEAARPILEVRAGLRTGDTPANERSAMLRRPPHVLVTTPESLFILLTSARFRRSLSAVRYVIVDELHALAPNKRGAHLMLTLERLERMVRASGAPRPARIGLSATLNPIERLAEFLAGSEIDDEGVRRPRPVKVVRADARARAMDLKVMAPGPDLGALATHQHWEAMYDAVAALVREHRTTLVFTLSRRWAERIALNLQKRLGNDAVLAHHGSLARAERLAAEQRLKRGELRALVATASLELGIDVGAVELVCQIDTPKSISAAIQRIGRSGHRLDATPKGRFFALTLDDLLECAAAVRAIRHGRLDEVELPTGCLDVAAQQIVAIAAEDEEIGEVELLRLLRGAHNFANLDRAGLVHLLEQMAVELPARIQGAAPKILYDRIGARVRARRGARMAAITSGGTIPESGNLDVVIESQGRRVGDVEEDFAQESSRGDIFALGSMPWRVLGISRNRFLVEPAPGMAPSLPFWQTESAGRSPALSAEVSALRGEISARLGRSASEADADAFLAEECALDERAARQAIDYVRRGESALGAIPDERTIVVERFFDGLGGTQVVIHSPLGMRVNRGLGLAIRKRLCQSFDFEIQASAIDDAVLLALNARHSFPLESLMAMLSPRTVRRVLEQALLAAPMFEVRMRHVATRALAVMRSARGRKVPAWIQRLRAQEIAAAIFPGREACLENRPPDIELPDHFITAETMHECLTESTDIGRIEELLRAIEQGTTRVVAVDAIAPSVFAHRILLAWDYSFLDDGERANRRSRTVSLNRAMAEDVLRTEDLSAMLAADAVESVEAEVSGRAMARRARDRDELYELIRAHGALAPAALDERVAGKAGAMLSALEREGRAVRTRFSADAPEMLVASEDAALFASAHPEATFARHADAPPAAAESNAPAPEADEAEREIVRRALATAGPVEIGELAARVRLPAAGIEKHLLALEAKGLIFRGHFTPRRAPLGVMRERTPRGGAAASPEQWCDRYNLEKIHRLTLNRLRSETEPAADHEYAAFRLRWNHVGGTGIDADQSGVVAVLEQLSGVALSPELWERAILPARVPGYRPEWLDLLCLGGEVVWAAVPGENGGDEVPARITFLRRRRAGAARHEGASQTSAASPASSSAAKAVAELADPDEQHVLLALVAGGAQYLDQLAERAGLAERTALAALWRLAAAGRVSNDSFAPPRLLWSAPEAVRAMAPGAHRRARRGAALRARLRSSVTGRWSALGAGDAARAAAPAAATPRAAAAPPHGRDSRSGARAPEREQERALERDTAREQERALERDTARERAELLLKRNGIVTREMLGLESEPMAWQEISFALRRMEYAGAIRRGYFVRALSGEQYALPAALEMLAAARNPAALCERPVALSAADPANPFGAVLPGCGVARDASNFVVLRGGRVMLGLAGRALVTVDASDDDALSDEAFSAAVAALIELVRKVVVETIDGAPALASARVGAMAAMGFHSDGRALVYDGLPGPAPSRASVGRRAE